MRAFSYFAISSLTALTLIGAGCSSTATVEQKTAVEPGASAQTATDSQSDLGNTTEQSETGETATNTASSTVSGGVETDTKTNATATTPVVSTTVSGGASVRAETVVTKPKVVEINLTAKNWEFSPSAITVNKGDTVRIKVTSADIEHGINIEGYNINIPFSAGEEKVIEFVADKTGSFTFRCSVPCGPGHKEMRGTLIVK